MSFIDDNCAVFDAEEENKFSYTDIHKVLPVARAELFFCRPPILSPCSNSSRWSTICSSISSAILGYPLTRSSSAAHYHAFVLSDPWLFLQPSSIFFVDGILWRNALCRRAVKKGIRTT